MAGDPSWLKVKSLLLFSDPLDLLGDETGRIWVKNGNAVIDEDELLFGQPTLYLDGTGDYLLSDNSADLNITDDFTLECFIRRENMTGVKSIYTNFFNANSGISFQVQDNGVLRAAFGVGSVFSSVDSSPGLIQALVWHHVAVSAENNIVRTFIDGNKVGEKIISGRAISLNPHIIGSDLVSSERAFRGWMSQFRFTLGVARYTADFTPPDNVFLNYSTSLNIQLDENLAADEFICVATSLSNGDLNWQQKFVSTQSFDMPIVRIEPVLITLYAEIGELWTPESPVLVNQKCFPTNPSTTPYYFRCTIAGTTGATEPNWLTGTAGAPTADGDAQWELVERIPQPITHGPLIPQ